MELFKTDCLNKEFKEFSEKLMPAVLKCGYCNKLACDWMEPLTLHVEIAEKLNAITFINLVFQRIFF